MKSIFLLFLLFESSKRLEIIRPTDKCNRATAEMALRWLGDPIQWQNTYLPLDYFAIEVRVSEGQWRQYCYRAGQPIQAIL